MEHGYMFDYVVEFSQETILNEFCLQETSFIDWAVEKSIEAYVPEEIRTVLFGEEIFWKVPCEITQLILKQKQRVGFFVIFN